MASSAGRRYWEASTMLMLIELLFELLFELLIEFLIELIVD